MTFEQENLKGRVKDYWNQQSCDTQVARSDKFSKTYFEEIESFRYFDQPFIHAFAQFSRYHGKRVLEVGYGAGTDFVQWLRAGASATGVDLTPEALDNLQHRIKTYGLPAPERILLGDAENLPFESNQFDLGYSFGVLHHSPDTPKALSELIRVVKPGGEIKVMLYNRHSIFVFNMWLKKACLKGRPWKTLKWALWNHVESIGTKGYCRKELRRWLHQLPLENILVTTETTAADYLSAFAFPPLNQLYRLFLRAGGPSWPWHPNHYVARGETASTHAPPARNSSAIRFAGNKFGFFHCITARKK
jgi:ubiquinone/menaquinone biosynthesis C-methylase UbiE